MPQLFTPAADTITRSVLFAAVLVPLLLVGMGLWAGALALCDRTEGRRHPAGAVQPRASRRRSSGSTAAIAIPGSRRPPSPGVPPTETCMTCHSQIWTNAAMLAPVRESFANDMPIHWQRVHRLPDYVYFDHSIHVAKGVGCTTCHGAVNTMPLMFQAAPLTMGWCLDCHRDPGKNLRPRFGDLLDRLAAAGRSGGAGPRASGRATASRSTTSRTAPYATDEPDLSRRSALKLLSANMALIVAGCGKPPEEIVPYVHMPERLVPGVPLQFASTLPLGGYRARRPLHLGGGPAHQGRRQPAASGEPRLDRPVRRGAMSCRSTIPTARRPRARAARSRLG